MKRLLVILVFFLATFVHAEVIIDPKHHIQNRDPGLCSWCSLETLGLTHNWKKLDGLTAGKKKTDYHENLVKEMQKMGIKIRHYQATETEWYYYVMYENKEGTSVLAVKPTLALANHFISLQRAPGSYWIQKKFHWKSGFLRKAIADNLGAAVSIDGLYPTGKHWRHMLVLTDMNDKEVKMVDSNDNPGKIQTLSLGKFLDMWNGFAIVIEKKL